MITFLLAATLSCPMVKMENRTSYPWNQNDRDMLASAKRGCQRMYKRSPCVKLFRKRGAQDYSVICGATTEKRYL